MENFKNLFSKAHEALRKVAVVILYLILSSLCLFTISCNKTEEIKATNKSGSLQECNFDNPLTDLPWLKEIIDEIEAETEAGYGQHTRIYQCSYRDGIGFLLELCVECPDIGYLLKNCKGESLCILRGFAGDPCTDFEVNFENKELLYEINN